jgi:hypothetical protein
MQFNELLGKLNKLALILNTETVHTVFVEYSGHVHHVEVRFFTGGWRTQARPDKTACFYGPPEVLLSHMATPNYDKQFLDLIVDVMELMTHRQDPATHKKLINL